MNRNSFFVVSVLACFALLLTFGCEEQSADSKTPQVEPKDSTTVADNNNETAVSPRPSGTEDAEPESNNTAVADTVQRPPKISLDSMEADFGEAGPGMRKSEEIKITNVGEGILKLTKIGACCGCTATMDKKELKKGQSGTLKISCSLPTRAGTFSRTLYIESNDRKQPKVGIGIKAKIVPKVDYNPKALRLFLNKPEAGCPPITLKSLDGKAFSITRFRSTANVITADIDPAVEATEFTIQPKVDEEKLKRGLAGAIEISLTHPEAKGITIGFSTLARYKLSPPQLILFNAEEGKPIERKIWVLNNYGEAFDIESTSTRNNHIKVKNTRELTDGYEFEVEITPPASEGKALFTDTFYVNLSDGERVSINCRGFYLRK